MHSYIPGDLDNRVNCKIISSIMFRISQYADIPPPTHIHHLYQWATTPGKGKRAQSIIVMQASYFHHQSRCFGAQPHVASLCVNGDGEVVYQITKCHIHRTGAEIL